MALAHIPEIKSTDIIDTSDLDITLITLHALYKYLCVCVLDVRSMLNASTLTPPCRIAICVFVRKPHQMKAHLGSCVVLHQYRSAIMMQARNLLEKSLRTSIRAFCPYCVCVCTRQCKCAVAHKCIDSDSYWMISMSKAIPCDIL